MVVTGKKFICEHEYASANFHENRKKPYEQTVTELTILMVTYFVKWQTNLLNQLIDQTLPWDQWSKTQQYWTYGSFLKVC